MNETPEVIVENKELAEAARTEGLTLLEQAKGLAASIKDDTSFTAACEFRATINKARAARFDKLDPIRKKLYSAYKDYMALMDEVLDPFDQSIRTIDRPIADYNHKREQEAEAERERQRRAAQKVADDAKLAAAMEAQATGDTARAEAILEKPTRVVAPRVPEPPKVKGMAFKENWKIDSMINMRVLVKAIAEGNAQIELVMPNMPVLNQLAKALKDKLNIPGVKAISENVVASSKK